jgi:hypothetical protein
MIFFISNPLLGALIETAWQQWYWCNSDILKLLLLPQQ